MRSWINLLEKWDSTVEYGTDVFRNPSRNEFAKIMRDTDGEARLSFCQNGDLLVFDGNMVTHGDIESKYRTEIDSEAPTAMVGRRPSGSFYVLFHHAYSFTVDFVSSLPQWVRANPNVSRMLGRDYSILAENDSGEIINLDIEEYRE